MVTVLDKTDSHYELAIPLPVKLTIPLGRLWLQIEKLTHLFEYGFPSNYTYFI